MLAIEHATFACTANEQSLASTRVPCNLRDTNGDTETMAQEHNQGARYHIHSLSKPISTMCRHLREAGDNQCTYE
jgi:hypothetical protein